MMCDSTCKEAATQNQKNVGKYRPQHTGLHNTDFPILERYYADLQSSLAVDESYGAVDEAHN